MRVIVFRNKSNIDFIVREGMLKKDIKIREILEMAKGMGIVKVFFKLER